MPKSMQVVGSKKVEKSVESGGIQRNILIGSLSPVFRSIIFKQLHTVLTFLFCLPLFFSFFVLVRLATDYSAHTPLLLLFNRLFYKSSG